MTPWDLRNIHTTGNCYRDTLPCTSMHRHGTKTTMVFLSADREASWLLLSRAVSLLSGSTVQPENTYSCILYVTGQV